MHKYVNIDSKVIDKVLRLTLSGVGEDYIILTFIEF